MNKKHFFQNGILLCSVGLVVKTVGIIFSSFIAKKVGAEGVGLYTLIMASYSFAQTFSTSGITLTVTRLVSEELCKEKSDTRGVLRASVKYVLIFSVLSNIGLFALSHIIGVGFLGDGRTTLPLKILSFSLIPVAMSAVFAGYFVGVERVSQNAIVQVVGQTSRVGITVLLLMLFDTTEVENSLIALSLGLTLTEFLSFLLVLLEFFFDRKIHFLKESKADKTKFKEVAKMAFPLAVSAYIRSGLLSIEHSLIPKLLMSRGDLAKEAFSSYGFLHGMALPLILYPMSILTSFSSLLVPEFSFSMAKGNRKRLERVSTSALNATLFYSTAVCVFLWLFAEELSYNVFSSYEVSEYIVFLCPVVPIMYLDHVTDSMLKGIGEQVFSMWVNITDSLISLVLIKIFIPLFGIYGYAYVIVGMEVFNFALSAMRLHKHIKFKVNFGRAFFLPFAVSVLSAKISLMLFRVNGSATTTFLLILKMVFALCTFIAIKIAFDLICEKIKRSPQKRAPLDS